MKYEAKQIVLKDGRTALLKEPKVSDARHRHQKEILEPGDRNGYVHRSGSDPQCLSHAGWFCPRGCLDDPSALIWESVGKKLHNESRPNEKD